MSPAMPTPQIARDAVRETAPSTRLRVGTAPVNWNNDDVPDMAPHLPCAALLDEMAAAGYTGTEFGVNFPRDAHDLNQALAARGLVLSGAYQWLHLLDDDQLPAEIDELGRLLRLLAQVNCQHLIIAVAMTKERIALAGHVPADGGASLTEADWDRLGRNASAVAHRAAEYGLRVHYHNHVGSHVETPAEVDCLLRCLDTSVIDLCFDSGHYAYGGGDPVAFAETHADQIGYVHLKDVHPDVLSTARAERWSFLDALRSFIFCEFGRGLVDIQRIVNSLQNARYAGWVVVEQDTSSRPSTESARANRRFLQECCGI